MALTNLTKVQTVGIGSNIEVVGVVTTGQFKSGTSNLHSTGIELTNLNVSGIATIGGNLSIGGTLTYEDVTNIDSIGIITARAGVNVSGGQLDVGSNIKLGNAGVITATSFIGSGAALTGIAADKIFEGNTEAEVVDTGSDGHFKVTTEGSERLRINSNGSIQVTPEGSTSNPYMLIDTSGDSVRFNAQKASGNNEFRFLTQSSGTVAEKLRITSGGQVNIGDSLSQTTYPFSVEGSSNTTAIIKCSGNDTANFFFDANRNAASANIGLLRGLWNGTSVADIRFLTGADTSNKDDGQIALYTAAAGTPTERLRIDAGGGVQVGTSTATASKVTVYGANDAAAIFQGSSTGTGAGNGLLVGNNGGTTGLLWNYENGPVKIAAQNAERVRIETDGSCYFGPQIITEADMGWGHDAHQRPFVFSGNQAGVNPADATIVVANPNTDPPSTRLGSFMFGCKSSSAGNSGIKAYIEGWTTSNPSNTYEAGGYIKFVTRQSGGSLTEHFKIDHDGKLYKSGSHFYPLVNYSEYATFTGVSITSNSYTDLRTILSSYTPKKAGNLIVIHHQSQCWQGGHANSNGDAMWRIQKQEGGGSWTTVIANERIMGNMDGRNYTGGSGLARHHRTVHLMGSFECAGTSISLKTQGLVDFTGVGLQWYHHSQNILQVWEYGKG